MAEHSEVLGLAAQIVSAHVSHNAVPSDQLAGLIRQVFNSLATAEQATTVPPKPESAVTVRQSVTAGHIVCLDCGKHFSMLKRHLMTDHKLPPSSTGSDGSCHGRTRWSHLTMQRRDRHWRRQSDWVAKGRRHR